ncbi:hypothetical protein Pcinc_023823 [Petrolisthes cinctipes]|uniref:Uncharacterized protein n=1 Tax=Petrolisthes cinctipes TaxID=88211 RepID=A0AAE1FB54_PETCI|nr:hypothetical protein Pcinc_023823 [Petrolisthes cinctipes]
MGNSGNGGRGSLQCRNAPGSGSTCLPPDYKGQEVRNAHMQTNTPNARASTSTHLTQAPHMPQESRTYTTRLQPHSYAPRHTHAHTCHAI